MRDELIEPIAATCIYEYITMLQLLQEVNMNNLELKPLISYQKIEVYTTLPFELVVLSFCILTLVAFEISKNF